MLFDPVLTKGGKEKKKKKALENQNADASGKWGFK